MSATDRPGGRGDLGLAALALLAFGTWAAARALTTEGFLEADEVAHYLYARHVPSHPMNLLQVWARPLFTALLVPFARLGFPGARFLALGSAVLAAACAYAACRRLGWRTAACAIPLAFAQPLFFQQSSGIWTEVTFAALLSAWVLAVAAKRATAAAVVAAALPLVRPEGAVVAFTTALFVLSARSGWKPRLATLAILPAGVLSWAAAGFFASGDPLWLPHHWPPDWAPSVSYGSGSWTWVVGAASAVVPAVLIPLLVLGCVAPGMRAAWPVPFLCALVIVVHAILWKVGAFGSAGYARYFVTLTPAFAVLMTGGVEVLARILRPVPPAAWLLLASGVAVFLLLRHPTATVRPPMPPDGKLFAALGKWLRTQDPHPLLFSAHPFAYLELDSVPPDRFEDLGRIPAAVLSAAPAGAWLLEEDRFYTRVPGDATGPAQAPPVNPRGGDLRALGYDPVAVPDLGVDLAVSDPRHDPAIQHMQWALYRKRVR